LIDWLGVATGALWIVGLGIILTAIGFAHYQSHAENKKLGQVLGKRTSQFVVDLGMIFFCLGLMGSVEATWERILWGILSLVFAIQSSIVWRTRGND
jgi:hypothetical protein